MFPFGNKNKIYYVYSFNRQKYFYAYVNILGGQHLFWVLRLSHGFDSVKNELLICALQAYENELLIKFSMSAFVFPWYLMMSLTSY